MNAEAQKVERLEQSKEFCKLCSNTSNCPTCEKLKRRVRVIIDQLDQFDCVLGTVFQVQLLASRFFLECFTVLDNRNGVRRAPDVALFLRKHYQISPIYVARPRPSYRWLLFL